jgi:mono/diheme cytochrome c family protein
MIFRQWVFCFGLMVMFPVAMAAESMASLYQQHCAVCHGEKGDGQSRARYGLNPPPRDFTSPRAWDDLTPERIRTSIRYGRPGTGMVAWDNKLTTDEIDGLALYVRDSFMRKPALGSEADGVRLYKKHCAACHGDRGNGAQWTQYSLNPSPRDFTAAAARDELSRERMINSVTHGRPGTAMMSFSKRLSNQQISSIVDYIRGNFMQLAVSANAAGEAGNVPRRTLTAVPSADMSLAFPHGLVGDVQRGRQFYMSNCFTCHGRQGLGDGPRSGFINPRPRNFVAAESRRTLNRPALFRAIARGKQGTVMPAWATVLDNQQIVDVAEFVFQSFVQGAVPAVPPDEALKKKALN